MAALHSGKCQFSCDNCQNDPDLKKHLGCEEAPQGVVWDDRHGEIFFNCPIKWLSDDVIDWYQEYIYNVEIGGPLPFREQSSKYIEAFLVYRHFLGLYQADEMDKKMKRPDNDDLDRMGANLMAQKRAVYNGK